MLDVKDPDPSAGPSPGPSAGGAGARQESVDIDLLGTPTPLLPHHERPQTALSGPFEEESLLEPAEQLSVGAASPGIMPVMPGAALGLCVWEGGGGRGAGGGGVRSVAAGHWGRRCGGFRVGWALCRMLKGSRWVRFAAQRLLPLLPLLPLLAARPGYAARKCRHCKQLAPCLTHAARFRGLGGPVLSCRGRCMLAGSQTSVL